jgi:hypothetical protein
MKKINTDRLYDMAEQLACDLDDYIGGIECFNLDNCVGLDEQTNKELDLILSESVVRLDSLYHNYQLVADDILAVFDALSQFQDNVETYMKSKYT